MATGWPRALASPRPSRSCSLADPSGSAVPFPTMSTTGNAAPSAVTDLVRILRWMVDRPDDVEVRDGETTVLEARVAPDDVGKVLGRSGRTVRSLRALLRARGERDGARYE